MERYIFLDTNIYINAGYSFGSMHMKKFSELVSNDGLVLLAWHPLILDLINLMK